MSKGVGEILSSLRNWFGKHSSFVWNLAHYAYRGLCGGRGINVHLRGWSKLFI